MHFTRRNTAKFLAALAIAACGEQRASQSDTPDGAAGLRGNALGEPLAKPSFVLERVDGTSFDFGRETEGKVALLFFGYTHCPDVCPLHMANIAAVLKRMSWEDRDAIRVVFVTTDPERDTPQRLREWLGGFDPAFIGLRGETSEVERIQRSLGLAPAVRQADSAGGYLVGHAAQVIAFGRDNIARVVYPFGTRQEDWAYDLPRLVRARATAPAGAPPTRQPDLSVMDFAIAPAVAAAANDGSSAALYLTVLNNSEHEDTLRAVNVIGGGQATLHETSTGGGMSTMREVPWLVVPARGVLEMRPGGAHVMLAGPGLTPGRAAAGELHFARRGRVTLPIAVVGYAQLDSVLALARSSLPPR